ncbi:hypothetical protein RhiirA4_421030 [Rhizophagus irregularis]|uniref:Uncharacterized protein n=1 Tax=Rhizophagus irregularis TaxID=588596 RepID=A0A2I1GK12_9GLOM|nr:hypothetical protein RhiirA4_421030 [Rhizophagus irregularis]
MATVLEILKWTELKGYISLDDWMGCDKTPSMGTKSIQRHRLILVLYANNGERGMIYEKRELLKVLANRDYHSPELSEADDEGIRRKVYQERFKIMLQPLLEKPDALFFGINGCQMTFAASKYVKTYSKQSKQSDNTLASSDDEQHFG